MCVCVCVYTYLYVHIYIIIYKYILIYFSYYGSKEDPKSRKELPVRCNYTNITNPAEKSYF